MSSSLAARGLRQEVEKVPAGSRGTIKQHISSSFVLQKTGFDGIHVFSARSSGGSETGSENALSMDDTKRVMLADAEGGLFIEASEF